MWGLCELAQCTWCGLGGGWTQGSTQTFQWCTKHPQGPWWRCGEGPWGGAREDWRTEKSKRSDWKWKCWSGKKMKKASDQVLARIYCNDQFPWRQESPQGLADLGSAIGLAPQSPGLLGGLRDGTGVS